uniref:C2H2-type domain-containing protein n=1 Tax=Anopheles epiroticus TaxID=199890 RepID=A0A182PD06_9DIPT
LTDEQIDNQSDNVSIASPKHDATCSAEDGTYCCNECSLEFSDSNDLKKHYDAKHANVIYSWESFGISQISLFDSSDEEMQEQDKWTIHRNAAQVLHPTQVPQTFRCCGCNLIFDTDADLKQHSETTHASNALHVDGDYGFQCNVCYKLFTSSSALGNHQNIQYFLRFQCATCGLLFGTQLQLTRHEFKHMRGKFTCDTCDKIFSTPKSLRIHIKRFHTHPETVRAKEKHICSQCGKSLHSAAYLVCHLKLHSKEEPFRCNLCGARFKLVRYLQWHMAKHKQLYQCKQCESSFKSPSELEEHMNRHTGTRAFFCFICGNGFYNKKNLNKHLQYKHEHPHSNLEFHLLHDAPEIRHYSMTDFPNNAVRNAAQISLMLYHHSDDPYDDPADSLSVESANFKSFSLDKHAIYHCCECVMDFYDSDALEEHYESKHANTIYGWQSFGINEISLFDTSDEEERSEEEAKEIKNTSSVVQETENHKNIYRCCGCKAVFDTSTELQQHSKTVHDPDAIEPDEDKPFQCEICYRTFSTKNRMKEHHKNKYLPLRYQCAICGKMFLKLTQCALHEDSHNIALKVTCDVCGKTFANEVYLTKHKQTMHVDPSSRKKYVCKVCGAQVLSTSYLKVHMQLHAEKDPYSCILCGVGFKTERYLKWHMRKHNALYTCKLCGIPCRDSTDLQEHMNSHSEGMCTQRYQCAICGKMFPKLRQCNLHEGTHNIALKVTCGKLSAFLSLVRRTL